MKIKHIHAYEILASGGYPSIECVVTLDSGTQGKASVPYGASAGTHEAAVLLDQDAERYNGKGMLTAIQHINQNIAKALVHENPENQREIDQIMIELDGTENKSKLGGNAILAVSLAVAHAVANTRQIPLYVWIQQAYHITSQPTLPAPMVVAIEGGKHAHNTTDLQEYCISAVGMTTAKEQIRAALEAYHQLKKVLQKENLSTNVGNEGAFAPNGIASNEAPFNYIVQAIEQAGYKPGKDLSISIDAAASEFFHDGSYHLSLENRAVSSAELSEYYKSWMSKYPITTLEDMHHEDDWKAWVAFKKDCDQHGVTLIGDDLTVTNQVRLQKALDQEAISGILIKLNQIGTLTETVDTCMLASDHNLMTVPSHRGGGETNDTSMVDLAVAVGAKFIKVGPTRGERVAKYNRLMEIERIMQQDL